MFESTFHITEENDTKLNRVRVVAKSSFFTDKENKPVTILSNWFHTKDLEREEIYKDIHNRVHEFVVSRFHYTVKYTICFAVGVFAISCLIGLLNNS